MTSVELFHEATRDTVGSIIILAAMGWGVVLVPFVLAAPLVPVAVLIDWGRRSFGLPALPKG